MMLEDCVCVWRHLAKGMGLRGGYVLVKYTSACCVHVAYECVSFRGSVELCDSALRMFVKV